MPPHREMNVRLAVQRDRSGVCTKICPLQTLSFQGGEARRRVKRTKQGLSRGRALPGRESSVSQCARAVATGVNGCLKRREIGSLFRGTIPNQT